MIYGLSLSRRSLFSVCHTTSFLCNHLRTPLCAQMELNIKRMRKSWPMRACGGLRVCVCEWCWYARRRVRVRVHVINLEHCVTGYRHLLNLKIIGPTFNLIIKWSLIIWWWTKIKFVTLKSLCGTCLLCWAAWEDVFGRLKLLLMRKK